jgi:hypothetical protein
MNPIIEIATRVSTPLALSGLVAAFLFFIFRQIIAKNIFPNLTAALSGTIILTIINRLFVLALVAMILGFFGYVLKAVAGQSKPPHETVQDAPIIINSSGRLNRIAGNGQCKGDERSWVNVTSDVKIGLLGVRTGETPGEENQVDIRVIQTRNGKTHDIHPHKDWTVPLGVENLNIYIKPQIDDCWVDYEIYWASE